MAYYSTEAGIPTGMQATVQRLHVSGMIRLIWQPDHLLSIGLESGILDLYSYKVSDGTTGTVVKRAVPLLLLFSMPVTKRIQLYAGPGAYLISSKLNYTGTVHASAFSLGWMASASYEYPISSKIGIAGELKWLNAFSTRDASLTLQIQIKWKLLTW